MNDRDDDGTRPGISAPPTVGPCRACGRQAPLGGTCPSCFTNQDGPAAPPGTTPSSESPFPGYTVLCRVGEGGMGEVFQAHPDRYPRQLRAIKVLRQQIAGNDGLKQRFERERIAMQAIVKVPGVVAVHDGGVSADGRLFLVMDWVPGRSLAAAMEDDASPFARPDHPQLPALAADLVRQLGRSLDGAHAHGVIHRDIKPSNVMLPREPTDGGRLEAVLIDFGIASLGEPDRSHTGSVAVGTPASMAPEVLSGEAVTPRTDVYLLAHMMYRVLTGRRHTVGQIRRPSRVNRRFGRELDELFLDALAGAPEDRPASCGEFAAALADLLARVPEWEAAAEMAAERATAERARTAPASRAPSAAERLRLSKRLPVALGLSLTAGVVALLLLVGPLRSDRAPVVAELQGSEGASALEPGPTPAPGPAATPASGRAAEPTPTAVSHPAATPAPSPARTPSPTPSATPAPTPARTPAPRPSATPRSTRATASTSPKAVPATTPTSKPSGATSPFPHTPRPGLSLPMVRLPGGTFQMGSPAGVGDSDEHGAGGGQVSVTVSAFSLGKTEVTNAQYAAFLNARGSNLCGPNDETCVEEGSEYLQLEKQGDTWTPKSGKERHPAVEVSWYGAHAFAAWAKARLPTEAEWEYACRAGQQQTWAGTDEEASLSRYANVGAKSTKSVGSLRANDWHLQDLSGNVWEWTASVYNSPLSSSSATASPDATSPGDRVNRGGSFASTPSWARCANRDRYGPTVRGDVLGFRVALPAPPSGG